MPGNTYCSVVGCMNNTKLQKDMVFFRVPKERKRMEVWAECIGRWDITMRSNPSAYRVCSVHFPRSMIITKRLKPTAVPTLHLPGSCELPADKPGSSCNTLKNAPLETETGQPLCNTMSNEIKAGDPENKVKEDCGFTNETQECTNSANLNFIKVEPVFELPVISSYGSVNDSAEGHEKEKVLSDNKPIERLNTVPSFVMPSNSLMESDMVTKNCDVNNIASSLSWESEVVVKVEIEEDMNISDLNASAQVGLTLDHSGISTQSQSSDFTASIKMDKKEEEKLIFLSTSSDCSTNLVKIENKNSMSYSEKDIAQEKAGILLSSGDFFVKYSMWQGKLKSTLGGNRVEEKLNLFAHNLYVSSPSVYKFLQNTLNLPPVEAIKGQKINFSTGVCDDLITMLVKKIHKSISHKFCLISLKEMKLKRNLFYGATKDEVIGLQEIEGRKQNQTASHALVMVLRGCIEDYKQPLGYAFTGTNTQPLDISKWIDNTIKKLFDAGFVVCAVVSDGEVKFSNLAKSKGVTIEHPYFLVDNKKVYYVFDALGLFRSLCCNLFTHNFLYDGNKEACWKYIEEFYDRDKQRNIRMAPKLTDCHLKPDQDMEICLVKQVLSHSVAAGMSCEIEMEKLPTCAQGTVDFVLKMDQLFDVLNSNKISDINRFKQAFTGEVYQVKYLYDSLETFKNIKFIDTPMEDMMNDNEVLTCFQITINAILQLRYYFQPEGLKHVFTSRFTQDETVHFCNVIRQEISETELPTALKFKKTFSRLVFKYLLENPSSNHYEVRFESLFQSKSDDLETQLFDEQVVSQIPRFHLDTTDYKIKLPVRNSFPAVCDYLFKKVCHKHYCLMFDRHIIKFNKINIVPSDDFVEYVERNEDAFLKAIDECVVVDGVCQTLLDILMSESQKFVKPCRCFPVEYFLRLYLRMRIHFAVKLANKKFNSGVLDDSVPISHL